METLGLALSAGYRFGRETLDTFRYETVRNATLAAAVVTSLWFLLVPDELTRVVGSSFGFVLRWLALGFLSSVGVGCGLPTFVMFLGPLVAHVAIANTHGSVVEVLWTTRWECFWWGLGTALGELPPYFIARAARLAGDHVRELENEVEEVEDVPIARNTSGVLSTVDSCWRRATIFAKRQRRNLVDFIAKNIGFWTILVAASIPNPLFDLVGLYTGYMLVPFHHFFLACAIGKSCCKVFLQSAAVAYVFMSSNLEQAIAKWLPSVEPVVSQLLAEQRSKYSNEPVSSASDVGEVDASMVVWVLGQAWNTFLLGTALYFLWTVIAAAASLERQARENEDPKDSSPRRSMSLSLVGLALVGDSAEFDMTRLDRTISSRRGSGILQG